MNGSIIYKREKSKLYQNDLLEFKKCLWKIVGLIFEKNYLVKLVFPFEENDRYKLQSDPLVGNMKFQIYAFELFTPSMHACRPH